MATSNYFTLDRHEQQTQTDPDYQALLTELRQLDKTDDYYSLLITETIEIYGYEHIDKEKILKDMK